MMKILTKLGLTFCLALSLVACESMVSDDGGIPRIRSQRQVDAYNETVTAEADKLVCTKEKPLGSNISRFICMTVAQRDRLAQQTQDDLSVIQRGSGSLN